MLHNTAQPEGACAVLTHNIPYGNCATFKNKTIGVWMLLQAYKQHSSMLTSHATTTTHTTAAMQYLLHHIAGWRHLLEFPLQIYGYLQLVHTNAPELIISTHLSNPKILFWIAPHNTIGCVMQVLHCCSSQCHITTEGCDVTHVMHHNLQVGKLDLFFTYDLYQLKEQAFIVET